MRTRAAHLALAVSFVLCLVVVGCDNGKPQKIRTRPVERHHRIGSKNPVAGKKILLVHSYHPEYPWVAAITRGVETTLQGTGVDCEIFYMDTKRKTDEAWKVRAGELAARKVVAYQPDLVIAVDDNAQQYFAARYVDKTLPIVFCGVNADPSKYGYPASNVTGIIERPHFKDTLEFATQFRPIRRIAVLSSDDPTSVGALSFMKESFVDVEVDEVKLVGDFDEWKAAVHKYNKRVDALAVYMYHTVSERGNPESLDPKVVMAWTAQDATIPTLGFFDFGVEDGLLLGVVESGFEHGDKAAGYALEILSGTPISSLPITKAHVGMKMINTETAQRLGVRLTDEAVAGARLVP